MKVQGRSRGKALLIPNFGARLGSLVNAKNPVLPPEKSSGTHHTVGWVSPRVGLEVHTHTHTHTHTYIYIYIYISHGATVPIGPGLFQ
jgi:hypothetical protein